MGAPDEARKEYYNLSIKHNVFLARVFAEFFAFNCRPNSENSCCVPLIVLICGKQTDINLTIILVTAAVSFSLLRPVKSNNIRYAVESVLVMHFFADDKAS